MSTPHIHAKFIKLWADGAQLQAMYIGDEYARPDWVDTPATVEPTWRTDVKYRVKPIPTTLRFLLALLKDGEHTYGRHAYCVRDALALEADPMFVRWYDDDWQTVTADI